VRVLLSLRVTWIACNLPVPPVSYAVRQRLLAEEAAREAAREAAEEAEAARWTANTAKMQQRISVRKEEWSLRAGERERERVEYECLTLLTFEQHCSSPNLSQILKATA